MNVLKLDDDKIRQLAQMNGLEHEGPIQEVAARLFVYSWNVCKGMPADTTVHLGTPEHAPKIN